MDFSVEYKKGAKNTVTDAVSRVETTGERHGPIDEEISCFCVESEGNRIKVEPWSYSDPSCNIDEEVVDDVNLFGESLVDGGRYLKFSVLTHCPRSLTMKSSVHKRTILFVNAFDHGSTTPRRTLMRSMSGMYSPVCPRATTPGRCICPRDCVTKCFI